VNDNNDIYLKYKNLYRDIIFGYSEERFRSNKKKVYIKHLNDLETGQSERKHQDFIFLAKERGLKSEDESIKFLIEEKIWSKDKEDRILYLEDKVSSLKNTKYKLIIKSQLSQLEAEIKPVSDELYILSRERMDNVGMTAENFANKKISEMTIQSSFFKDRSFDNLFYSEEEFDYLEQAEVNEALSMYGGMVSKKFAGDEIKRVAVCPFFMNVYAICGDNPYNFFGKPILNLTNIQVSLMSQAKYFKGLMSNHKSPPEDYYKSPDKIIEWFELQSKTAEVKDSMENRGEAGGKTLIGANKDEIKSMESEEEGVMNLNKQIEKHGGSMEFEEILKMHGL
tara:strand:+ start:7714 stop:8727 length:1014 start_codon:yes stop_codon:yes gene_type:complete